MTTKAPLPADAKVQRAVTKLVQYLEYSEYRHYCDGPERGHIWHAVKVARDWLDLPRIENAFDD